MKQWIHRVLVLSALTIFFAAGKAVAQDAGMSEREVSSDRESVDGADKIVFSPGESEVHYVPKASGIATVRDSVALVNPAPEKAAKPGESTPKDEKPKDESVLTFNFLYYIIQKYKLQDIID